MALAWRSERCTASSPCAASISACGRPARRDELLEARSAGAASARARAASVSARLADRPDDEIDVGDRHPRPFDDLALRLGLPQLEARAARHDVAPVRDERVRASA